MTDARRHTFLLGRYCAKQALRAALGTDNRPQISILPGVFGQPLVQEATKPRVGVSISHTTNIGGALVFDTAHPMGLDIACADEEMDLAIRAHLTERENDLIKWPSSQYCRPIIAWTIKEALAKILLTGLMTPLPIYEISELHFESGLWTARAWL